jgi:hypothetical protein
MILPFVILPAIVLIAVILANNSTIQVQKGKHETVNFSKKFSNTHLQNLFLLKKNVMLLECFRNTFLFCS